MSSYPIGAAQKDANSSNYSSETGVGFAQAGARLANRPEIRLCSTCSDGLLFQGEASVSDAAEEYLNDGDGIGDLGEAWVVAEGVAEGDPHFGPDASVGRGSLSNHAGEDLCLRSAEVTAESISGLGRQICHDRSCGCCLLK